MGNGPEDKKMKTTVKIAVISGVVVLALAAIGAGFVFAQTSTPTAPWGGGYSPGHGMMGGYGGGMMGGQGMMGNGYSRMNGVDMNAMHQWMSTSGGMHALVWNGLAEALGLTPDELNAELVSGKTLLQIAEAKGISQEQLAAKLETLVKAGLDKAVADGVLTQAQADQMLSHMSGNYSWMITHMGNFGGGFGPGGCHGNFVPPSNS
jgi:uncharacterized protein YidB (DUF937 family)